MIHSQKNPNKGKPSASFHLSVFIKQVFTDSPRTQLYIHFGFLIVCFHYTTNEDNLLVVALTWS